MIGKEKCRERKERLMNCSIPYYLSNMVEAVVRERCIAASKTGSFMFILMCLLEAAG